MGLAKILGFSKPEQQLPPFLTDGTLVDPEDFDCPDVEVRVNGKKTPLKIGNSFLVPGDERPYLVTIGGIMVSADKSISYMCEWTDQSDGSQKTEIYTLDQIKRFVRRSSI